MIRGNPWKLIYNFLKKIEWRVIYGECYPEFWGCPSDCIRFYHETKKENLTHDKDCEFAKILELAKQLKEKC